MPSVNASDAFLTLLEAALHEKAPEALSASIDWPEVYALARQHRVGGLLLDTVLNLDAPPPEAIVGPWQEHAMVTLMQQIQFVDLLHTVLTAFDQASLKAIVIKGVALKLLYPNPDMRTMSDADLLVAPEAFLRSQALLQAQGFIRNEQDSTDAVYVCDHPVGLRIELHQRLFDKKQQGFLSKLDENVLFDMAKAERMAVYGGEAWVYPPTEHALFMLLHMAKHMIVTGFGLRQVSDFLLFVERYDARMDWAAFWQTCKTLSLERFASSLLTLCHLRLGLPEGQWRRTLPVAMDREAAELLLTDLLEAGVFGKSSQERTRSAAVVYRSFDSEAGNQDSKAGRLRRAIFVQPSELKPPYLYAKRHPMLLPIAWVHRLLRFFFQGQGNARLEAAEGMRIADERLALLEKLGMRG